MNRLEEIRRSLLDDGASPARAEQIVRRYVELTKKKRPKKLKPINRDRGAVKAARSALAKEIKALFDKERPNLAHQIATLLRRTGKSDDDRVESIMSELDFDGWVTLVVDGEKILVHIVVDGSGEAVTQVGQKLSPAMLDQVNEAAVDWARERSAEMVGMKYAADGTLAANPNAEWAITDSTRELLRTDVAKAIEEGMSPAELGDLLEESYTFSSDRADTIARTEIANADVQGSLIGYAESGVVEGKELILSDSHSDPDECDDAAAMGVVPLEDDFSGLGDPPYHPNCECDVLPVLSEEE
jgi:hypothetical protein